MKFIARAAVVSVLLLPALSFAQTNADVAAQAKALLDQITKLQAQLGLAQGGVGGATGGACYTGGPVKPGASGANVTALQKFLAADTAIYPEANISGFYGPLTQAAVGRWQAKNGIVSSGSPTTNGYGSVGPRTAAAMATPCGGVTGAQSGDPVVGGFIKVSPTSGEPPLKVIVEATINTVKSCDAAIYTLNWGDGTLPISISIPQGRCDIFSQSYTHTYNIGGDYELSLSTGAHKTSSVVTVNGGGGVSMGNDGTFGTNSTGGSASTGGSSLGSVPVSGTLAISMLPHAFSPSSVTIKSGTRVTWTNTDASSHTVSADNASYNSGTMQPGQSYSLTFTAKGEYTYYCAFHGGPGGVGMAGKIIVQ